MSVVRWWEASLIAAASVAAAAGLRLALGPVLGDDLRYVTFFAAVIVAAWYGGLRPGLLATALSLVVSSWMFILPHLDTDGIVGLDGVGAVIFGGTGLLVSIVADRLHVARAEAHRAAERLRTTLLSIGDAVIVTDAAGAVTVMNPLAESLTGVSSTEATGRPLRDVFRLVEAGTQRPVDNPVERALRDGRVVELSSDTLLIGNDGRQCPIEDSAAPVRGVDGSLDGGILVFRDTTERRRREAALHASEAELSDLFSNASIGIQWVGAAGTVLRANQAQLDMVGLTEDAYVGQPMSAVHVDPDDARTLMARLLSGEVVRHFPARLRGPAGSVRDVLITSSVLWEDGRFVHSRCFTLDVTDRKRADEMQGLLAAVVEYSDDAVISKSLDGTILSWNAGAGGMFGYGEAEAVGQSINMIIPPELQAAETDLLARVRRGERVEPFETVRVARDGRRLDVSLSLSPVRDETGAITGASSIGRDISDRKALERSLRESDRRKDEFLAVLAHELRNPLAPIRSGVAALQLALPGDETVRRTAQIVERQVRQMSRLLDDLLDVARITHGKLELRKELITLQSAIEVAVETTQPLLASASQTLQLDVPDAPIMVMADPVRLAEVFGNLLSNASKYSPEGTPVSVTLRGHGTSASVEVRDRGIGLAPEDMPTLFEMFAQVTEARAHAQGGVGIGLALVKGLVDLHGGLVTATSEGPGKGSVFRVELPLAAGVSTDGAAVAADAVPASAQNRRVLVVDDNRDSADALVVLIEALGYEARAAYDGSAAVSESQAFVPDIVFMDLGMPGMDGYEAARRIRQVPGGDAIHLVALTGWGQDRDREQTREAGFDDHLVKPIDPGAMHGLLEGLAPRRQP